jgi:hypothetical protein
LIQFHARKGIDGIRQFYGEEAHAAVNIDEMPGSGIPQTSANGFDQARQQEEVILEKGIARDFPAFRRNPQHNFQAASWWRISADMLDLLIERGLSDFAFFEVHHETAFRAQETDIETLLGFVPLTADHNAIPVPVRFGAADDRLDQFRIESTDSLEEIGDLFVLQNQLGVISEMLVLATSALTEVATRRRNTVGRGFKDAEQFGASKTFFNFGDLCLDALADSDEGNKYDKILESRHTLPAESNIGDE